MDHKLNRLTKRQEWHVEHDDAVVVGENNQNYNCKYTDSRHHLPHQDRGTSSLSVEAEEEDPFDAHYRKMVEEDNAHPIKRQRKEEGGGLKFYSEREGLQPQRSGACTTGREHSCCGKQEKREFAQICQSLGLKYCPVCRGPQSFWFYDPSTQEVRCSENGVDGESGNSFPSPCPMRVHVAMNGHSFEDCVGKVCDVVQRHSDCRRREEEEVTTEMINNSDSGSELNHLQFFVVASGLHRPVTEPSTQSTAASKSMNNGHNKNRTPAAATDPIKKCATALGLELDNNKNRNGGRRKEEEEERGGGTGGSVSHPAEMAVATVNLKALQTRVMSQLSAEELLNGELGLTRQEIEILILDNLLLLPDNSSSGLNQQEKDARADVLVGNASLLPALKAIEVPLLPLALSFSSSKDGVRVQERFLFVKCKVCCGDDDVHEDQAHVLVF